MTLLVFGVLIWSLTHLFPAMLPDTRGRLFNQLGENRYKGVFALGILLGLVLIVLGWRSVIPTGVYAPPMAPNPLVSLLVLAALVLFAASAIPGNIRRYVRHPQMAAVILWGVAHLLTNGSNRAIVLFGGLTLWAVLEIFLCNKRDGEWQKPAKAAVKVDVITVAAGLVVFAVLAYFHPTFFGVDAIPGLG
jgi:uncharacterized membrane protein